MKLRFGSALVAIAVPLVFHAWPALALTAPVPMLPLEVGNQWEYLGVAGNHQVETITGTTTELGRTVFVKHFSMGGDAGLDNWWLAGPAGEVLLAGFDRHDGFTLGYEPPITVCGGAPALGDLWPTHVVVYDMNTMAVYSEFDITFGVLEDVTLNLPAGAYRAFGVGQGAPTAAQAKLASRGFSLDGRQLATGTETTAASATDWYSAGVGDVQYATDDLYQLTSFGQPTPVLTTSWGKLKSLYR